MPTDAAKQPETLRRTFEGMHDAHVQVVFNYLRRFLPRGNGAEDCLQETFTRLWRMLPHYREEGRARSYLLTIARNVALDHLDRNRREMTALAERSAESDGTHTPDLLRNASQVEISTLVRSKIAELPESQRETFLLYRYHGMSYREIARMQEVGVKTVESRLYRALKHLARTLRPYRGLASEEARR